MRSDKRQQTRGMNVVKGIRKSPGREEVAGSNRPIPAQIGNRAIAALVKGSQFSKDDRSQELLVEGSSLAPAYNLAIQDSRMTFAFFVASKFIPEHVEYKTLAGQTHYQAILKHLLKPETVHGFFNPQQVAKPRLKSVSGWPYLDEVRLCDISPDHVRRLISSAIARGYSSQTVKHIKSVFVTIISHAQREGCFSGRNPASQIKLPPMVRKKVNNLTISQARAILELMQYPDKEVALFAITTGMNLAEICELRWKYVNLNDSVRHIDGEVVPSRSIAVRTRWNRAGFSEVIRGRNRIIEVREPLLSHLRNLSRREEQIDTNEFVLVSETGDPIPPTSIHMARLKPIGKKLGLPWLSWQVLRRAHTSLLGEFRTALADQIVSNWKQRSNGNLSESDVSTERLVREHSTEIKTHSRPSFCFGLRSHKPR